MGTKNTVIFEDTFTLVDNQWQGIMEGESFRNFVALYQADVNKYHNDNTSSEHDYSLVLTGDNGEVRTPAFWMDEVTSTSYITTWVGISISGTDNGKIILIPGSALASDSSEITVTLTQIDDDPEEFLSKRGVTRLWKKIKDKLANKLDLSGGTMTGNIYMQRNRITAKDNSDTEYPLIHDNGTNLWIGTQATVARHHVGRTFISAGHNGSNGNETIYVAVPNANNDDASNYGVWHKGNLNEDNILDLMCYPEGTHTLATAVGTGYTTSTSGQIYIFPELPRPLPTGKTITITALTVTIRCAGKVIASNASVTPQTAGVMAGSRTFSIQLTGQTTNWTANMPVSVVIHSMSFTIS